MVQVVCALITMLSASMPCVSVSLATRTSMHSVVRQQLHYLQGQGDVYCKDRSGGAMIYMYFKIKHSIIMFENQINLNSGKCNVTV